MLEKIVVEKDDPVPEASTTIPDVISVDSPDDQLSSSSSSSSLSAEDGTSRVDPDTPPRSMKLASVLDQEDSSPMTASSGRKQYHDPLEHMDSMSSAIPDDVINIYDNDSSGHRAPDYLASYVHYIWCMEKDIAIRPNMERRKVPCATVTVEMRRCLVDWMFDISQEYRAQTTTLYLSVALLDRALDSLAVRREKLQLLGCACFLIAAKIEEVGSKN
jgi:hypothetical protein